jgi:hypothetical protein
MIVCDMCKSVDVRKNKPFECEVKTIKMEEKGASSTKKTVVPRELVSIQMHLCDRCITEFNQKLGHFIHSVRTNEAFEKPADLDKPVGVIEQPDAVWSNKVG